MYENPNLIIETATLEAGELTWRSPSNLALIKYWGKHGRQLPQNPSISFTLDKAFTETKLSYRPKRKADEGIELTFYFNQQENEVFRAKLVRFLEQMVPFFPFLRQLELTIHSYNSFPHSAGIASSASSMSALALCLCSLEHRLLGTLPDDKVFRQKASFIARLGSGSACRSIYAYMGLWGETMEVADSSDLYGVEYQDAIDPIFKSFHNDILIVSKGEKAVSSSAGHALMEGNIYAANRYQQARLRFKQLLAALKTGDLETFGRITESEALTLHALMMTSNPSYILMRPNSLKLIELVQTYRKETGNPLYFSLDAGPNLHLLYPDSAAAQISPFIKDQLLGYCENGEYIADKVGEGPIEL